MGVALGFPQPSYLIKQDMLWSILISKKVIRCNRKKTSAYYSYHINVISEPDSPPS